MNANLVANYQAKHYDITIYVVVFNLVLLSSLLSAAPIKAFVSILPQKFFVNAIAGTEVSVETLVKPGQSPETFEPSPSHIALLSKSKFLFVIGLPFERALLKKIKSLCPNLIIIHTDHGVTKRNMGAIQHNDHMHHRGDDPHIWLDPLFVKIQADNIANAITHEYPNLKKLISNNLNTFKRKLDTLSDKITKQLHFAKGRTILTFHPALGYFTDRFGLKQQSIEFQGKSPSPKQISKIIRKCKKDQIKFIYTEKQFASDAANTIAQAIGGKVVIVDPLAHNYIENLIKFSNLIAENMKR